MSRPKNILLVNPWIYDFTAYDFWLRPLGLLSIASLLRNDKNIRLHLIDCLNRNHPLLEKKLGTKPDRRGPFPKEEVVKPSVLNEVPRKFSRYGIPVPLFLHQLELIPVPDLVLLTCTMTYWYPGVQLAVELIRKKFGRIPVVLGGIYATLMPEHARRVSGADIIFQGLGENDFIPLVKEILGDVLDSNEGHRSFEDSPWPACDLLSEKDVLPVLTSKGCPFRCSFCASPLLFKGFEQRKTSSVVSEIEYHSQVHGTRHFAFYDDALLLNKKDHIIPILKELIERKLPVSFHTPNGLHVKEVDLELAALFRKANFQSLFLSQESFDQKVLAKAGSKVSTGDLEKALAHLEGAGYRRREINIYLMMGLPGQDVSTIKDSIRHVHRLGAVPRLAYFSPVPGTEEWQRLVNKGYLSQDADPLVHNKIAFAYLTGNISPRDFEEIKALASDPAGQTESKDCV